MIEIQIQNNTVKIFTDSLDKQTKQQIVSTARDPAYTDSKIRVMPDTHVGRGCVIGMTMTLNGRVSPSLVGVDIGCGMEVVRLEERKIDLSLLDTIIRCIIPAGKHIHSEIPQTAYDLPLDKLYCVSAIDLDRIYRSMGTLGGGNHFIEVDRGSDGTLYMAVHSGSRSLGVAVANHYRDEAYKYQCKKARRSVRAEHRDQLDMESDTYNLFRFGVDAYGDSIRDARHSDATKATRREAQGKLPVKWERAVCEGELYDAYLHDMAIAVQFAEANRRLIISNICAAMGISPLENYTCNHNYIDGERILRKGAISARQGEFVFIPFNMRDGAIIGRGLGNSDWNFSAPHGAGRSCSRADARHAYDVKAYQAIMAAAGVYTTTATQETIDECPMAYKSPERILPYLDECVEIMDYLKPIYNFKAEE